VKNDPKPSRVIPQGKYLGIGRNHVAAGIPGFTMSVSPQTCHRANQGEEEKQGKPRVSEAHSCCGKMRLCGRFVSVTFS
jgi:hypothetical protein